MLITPHAVVGITIGRVTRRPWLAVPAAFASHFALDMVPHIDSVILYTSGGVLSAPAVLICAADAAVALVVVLWMTRAQPHRRWLWLCAVAAVLMDIMDNLPPWNAIFRTWVGTGWLCSLHDRLHYTITPSQWLLGVLTQCAVVALAFIVLYPRAIVVFLRTLRSLLARALGPFSHPGLRPVARTSAGPRRIARGENPASNHQ